MRWEDERYVRFYTRDTPDWLALSFEAQALFALLLRKVDRAGVLPLGRHGKRAVAIAVGHAQRWEMLSSALEELLLDGCLAIDGDRLVIRNFLDAQEARQSDKARQQKARELARTVTPRDNPSQGVTESHTLSHDVTSGHTASRLAVPSRAEPSRAGEELGGDEPPTVLAMRPGPPDAPPTPPPRQRPPPPAARGLEHAFLQWADTERKNILGFGVLPDEQWTYAQTMKRLGFVNDVKSELLHAAYGAFLADEYAQSHHDPPCPMWVFARDWSKWVSRVAKQNAGES